MGNSMSRPSCLGEKSPQCEDFLKAPGLAARNNEEDHAGPLEKAVLSPRVIENGWNMALEGAAKGSPLPKQNNVDVNLQSCPPFKAQLVGAVTPQTSPKGSRSGWGWKLRTTREVTEVTETVVTEIVEVTEYPGSDGSQEALVTRTVKALADFRGALPEAAAFPGGRQSAGLAQEMVGKLLAWVSDVEDLVAHQKPPSGEARVVKAQLREQELLLRLLEERMSHIEHLCQGSQPLPSGPVGAAEEQEEPRGLASLQEKWAILVQEAEARRSSLQQILPTANVFQESVDSFQDWLSFTERMLAQLWRAQGSLAQTQEAYRQIQARLGMDLRKDIQSKPAELEQALEHGQHLWEMVPGEEAQLVQGKMDSLQMRLLVVGQRSSDTVQRLEQALEASSHLDPAQEDLALWLERMEKGQSTPGGQPGENPCPLAPADRDELEQGLRSELAAVAQLSLRLEELSQVPLNAQAILLALAKQKRLSAEGLCHQAVAERLVGVAGPLLRFCPADIQKRFQPLVRPLQEHVEHLDRQSSACALQLERVHLLLAQHAEAQAELGPWLEGARRTAEAVFNPSSISHEAFQEQQEVLQVLWEAIAENKSLMAKLQRMTMQLADLCPWEAALLRQSLQAAEEQHASLREHVQWAAAMLGEAIRRYSQLSEWMELVAGCLEQAQDRVRHPPALRGDPLWLQEQLWDSSLRLAELGDLGVALETLRGQGAELLATLQTAAHPAVQEPVRKLQNQWQVLWKQEEEREASLQELLALAGRFWPGLADLAVALSNAQQMVLDLEGAAASDPKDIRAKLVAMQALCEEADALRSKLDSLGVWGTELMLSCGAPEKPAIAKSLDDLYSSWNSLSKMWEERQNHLEDQLQALVMRQETRERLLAWLEEAEQRTAEEFLGGGDLVQVKQELSELEAFKQDLYQRQAEAESLWDRSSCGGAAQVDTPLASGGFWDRWTRLEDELVTRQHQLEAALLGQFQSQLQWLLHTTEQLRSPAPLALDLQSCEIELAKRQETSRSLRPPSSGGGGPVDGLQGSLQQLSRRWIQVLAETERRQRDLERHLSQVQEITLEITGLTQWLDRVELQLFSSKAIWGRPEATKDKLAALLELSEEVDSKRQAYQQVRETFQRLLVTCHPNQAPSAGHSLTVLEQKRGGVSSRMQERKEQLLKSLNMATEFHTTLQGLLEWIRQTEEVLAALPPPSHILDTVSNQRQQQQALAKETEAQSKKLARVEAEVARPKQDDGGPPSLVGTAKERLAKVRQRVSERGQVLEEAHQQAKQFGESWQQLLKWLGEAEAACAASADAATAKQEDAEVLLGQHKEFQKCLHVKRPVFEATLRHGRLLRAKALLPAVGQELDEMLRELKERWGALWSWAAERQWKLEEHLLFSGRFSNALQTLLEWLYRAEPQLAEETPVAGDRDLVGALMEKHKAFQKELGQRAVVLRMLRCSVHELVQGGGTADTQWLQIQMEELGHCWELIGQLSVSKQDRLEVAMRQAEEFHRLVHSFLGRLSELEKSVMEDQDLPEEEEAVAECQSQLKELQQGMRCQQLELECITSLGEEILSACHPDAVGTVQSRVAVAKNRFQQLRSWAQWWEQQLQAHAASRATDREEVEQLWDWISAAEESLSLWDQEPLPEDAEQLVELGGQHMVFMQELDHKQPAVEEVTKSCRRKRTSGLGVAASFHQLSSGWHGANTAFPRPPPMPPEDPEPLSPLLAQLGHRWQRLLLAALDRQFRLQNSQQRLQELEELASFDFAAWRKRYLQWISQRKSRVLDVFHSIDRDQDGRITQQEFIGHVLASKFPTSLPEMKMVAKIFDVNKDGFIDCYEFTSALHPSRDILCRAASVDQIQEEFGESQQLRMVRILRSTLMVRVGGGWTALDEFLVKNDPCRVQGRTNLRINEKYLSPGLMGRKGVGSQSAPTSKALSPSCSTSSLCRHSPASVPSSPVPRKAVLRRTRSGDRGLPSRSGVTERARLTSDAGAAGPGAEPPDHPRRDSAPSNVAAS